MTDEKRREIADEMSADPTQGDEIQNSGGVRKVRVAGRGKGKSGGYRIMSACCGDDIPVYLLAVLGKGDRANFSDAEVGAMRAVITDIKRFWKERRAR